MYPAPGAPNAAARAADSLEQAGFAVKRSAARGLDHGGTKSAVDISVPAPFSRASA